MCERDWGGAPGLRRPRMVNESMILEMEMLPFGAAVPLVPGQCRIGRDAQIRYGIGTERQRETLY